MQHAFYFPTFECILFRVFLPRLDRALLFLLPEEVGFLRYLRAAKVTTGICCFVLR